MISEKLIAVAISTYLAAAGDHAALYRGGLEPYFPKVAWTTHPYWQDEEFYEGSISFDGVLYNSVPMRYNIYNNVLSVISPESRIVVVPNPAKIDYFIIKGRKFVPQNGWFMEEVYRGEKFSLVYNRRKVKGQDVFDQKHYRSTLDVEERIYLVQSDTLVNQVSNLKSVIKTHSEYKKELKKQAKQLKLRFGHETQRSSLTQCAMLLDQLLASDSTQDTVSLVPAPQSVKLSAYSIPDTLWSTVPQVTRVPAFYAYSPGSKVRLEYGDDDDMVIENPGVAGFEALRETRTLEEVEVMGFRNLIAAPQGGMEAFRPSLLKNVPLAMGEADVLKLAMMLPGVSSTGEASSGLNVRGGASDQNLMLFNGNTVFNPVHMFGLFSAFNPDLVAESELYKGGIPCQYGGRLSSVMNIKGRPADMKKFHGSVSIGLVTAKAVFDLPIQKDKASLLIGGRTTYSDWMMKKLPSKSGYKDGSAGFWDLGGLLHINVNRNHSLNVSGYYSNDRFSFTGNNKHIYSNTNVSVDLKSRFADLWTTDIVVGYDGYDYKNEDTEYDFQAARLSTDIKQFFVKGQGSYMLNDSHRLNLGIQEQNTEIMPGNYQPMGSGSSIVGRKLKTDKGNESAAWVEDEWNINDQMMVTGGARINVFKSNKENLSKLYVNPDVRLSMKYSLNENNSFKVGFNTLHQYIHKVSNTVIMSPTDTWLLSNEKVKPQSGWQVSLGWYWQNSDLVYEFSVEGYYKGMKDYLTYRNGAQLVMNENLENDVVGANGRSYGVEVQLKKMTGKLNGWINYTYSRSQLKQEGALAPINGGDWFSSDCDCPHEVKFVGNYKFTRRYSTSLNVNYKTGRPYTPPVRVIYSGEMGALIPIYADRNECRMPDYFRVDWSFNFEPSHHLTDKTHRWLSLGIYNLLGRKNPYSIYYQSEGTNVQGYKLSIFGAPIPYISYNVKF